MRAAEVRSTFIEFFKSKGGSPAAPDAGHRFVPSSPCVPVDDPTLLFTNAGMNQFKPIFLGNVPASHPLAGLKRAVNSQKCIRAGGKHNDLDDVGKDTYHHTFFEMLGNWSFGDYFKQEAVEWSWELLTKVYKLPPEALYATYFEGNEKLGLPPDDETKNLWLKVLPPDHVLPGNMKDNFWEMGETGPCGPCTEIHVDRLTAMGIEKRNAAHLVNSSDPDVIEIWNNVFIQFDRQQDGSLRPLPAKHVDTGMGLERLVSVLQNKRSNYDTDVFHPIFEAIQLATNARSYRGRLGAEDTDLVDTAYRVIADHIRTLTFAITDGATPSNEGRGYVLRRILRRAVRFGRQKLNAKPGFFAQLVPIVVQHFGDAFPELRKDPQRVQNIILEEEESFGRTLDRGIKLFAEAALRAIRESMEESSIDNGHPMAAFAQEQLLKTGALKHSADITKNDELLLDVNWTGVQDRYVPFLSDADAFQLYDTYGFPIDLTLQMAEERGLKVDIDGYDKLMAEQKERSRAGSKETAATGLALDGDAVARLGKMNIAPTDDSDKFHGRDVRARVLAIWNGHNFDQHVSAGVTLNKRVGIIVDRTCFYAEMGGQVADHGRIVVSRESRESARDNHDGGEFRVEDAKAFGGYVLHIGLIIKGEIRVGDDVILHLDHNRRKAVASNHTATHLLNFGLRAALGEHVDQKGSQVEPDRFRFDFSNNGPVEPAHIAAAEETVRRQIAQNLTVYADIAPLFVSKQINGLRAVFGETYPDPVRVVSIGQPVAELLESPTSPAWRELSVEFCGGTHVGSTSEIGAFALVSETGVAKGIRRIEALTGVPAEAAIKAADDLESRIAGASTASDDDLPKLATEIGNEIDQLTIPLSRKHALRAKLADLQERVKAAQKRAAGASREKAEQVARQIADAAASSMDDFIIATIETGSDRQALQAAVNVIQQKTSRVAILLLSPDEAEGKLSIVAAVPKPLIDRGLKAGDWVRETAAACGGKGGGKPDTAQGGGSDLSKLKDASKAARTYAARVLNGG
ncbi:MAG: alanine--tRNA ligase [Phycisphaeraceae bacterium]|nr:alanine--tRNA ligase [Phycisphaeraceae bacterium]